MTRALFICSRNRLRSPTAEAVFAAWPGVETDSAGLAPDAQTRLSAEQLEWAEIVFVMERAHKAKLSARFGIRLSTRRLSASTFPTATHTCSPNSSRCSSARPVRCCAGEPHGPVQRERSGQSACAGKRSRCSSSMILRVGTLARSVSSRSTSNHLQRAISLLARGVRCFGTSATNT